MGTELQTTTGGNLKAWLQDPSAHDRIVAAVGDIMDGDQFIAQMLTAFQSPEVSRCSDKSKFTALHECAAMGLLPTLDQVKLIPYKNELKAMPQWQGLKAILERHPAVLEVDAHLVHKDDAFMMEDGEVSHCFNPFDEKRSIESAADIVGGYCKIIYADGRPPKYHFTPVKHIEKCRKCAQTQKVWTAWYSQMALKTIFRDAYARRAVPVDPLVQKHVDKIISVEDVNLGNNPNRVNANHQQHIEAAKEAALLEHRDGPEVEEANGSGIAKWMSDVQGCQNPEDFDALEMEIETSDLAASEKKSIKEALADRFREVSE